MLRTGGAKDGAEGCNAAAEHSHLVECGARPLILPGTGFKHRIAGSSDTKKNKQTKNIRNGFGSKRSNKVPNGVGRYAVVDVRP